MQMCSDTTGKLASAMIKAQRNMKPALKDCTNSFTRSRYASLNACFESCRDALLNAGLWITQYTLPAESGYVSLVTRITHSDSGEWLLGILNVPLPRNDPQGLGIALTYSRRYALTAMCGIVSDEDTDGEMRPMQRDEQCDTMPPLPEITGVVFTTIDDERGRKFVQATGQTIQNKESLQRSGFRWNPDRKAWFRPVA